jgi:beta-mannosidase
MNITSPILEYHQRSHGGNTRIIEMFSRYFRMPEGFEHFVYLSQVQQAIGIKTAVEHWRRIRPVCMGTLYWQLNDNWPVCSWSSLEYGGKWKLLHYAAKNFYAPLLVSAHESAQEGLQAWVNNDGLTAVEASLTLEVFDFSGRCLRQTDLPVQIGAGSSQKVASWPVADLAPNPAEAWALFTLRAAGKEFFNTHFFTEYKKCTLELPEISWQATEDSDGNFRVEINAKKPAFFVSLTATGIRGAFDDNLFSLPAGRPRFIMFRPKAKTTIEHFKSHLRIEHLRGTYA